MVSYHWLDAGTFGAWVVGAGLTNIDIDIPAGATLKRCISIGHIIQGTTNGVNLAAVGNFWMNQRLVIVGGPNNNHVLYRSAHALAGQLVGLYDVVGANRIYSQLINVGDEVLGFNVKTSIGKRTDPTFKVRYQYALSVGPGWTGLLSNAQASIGFAALYETLP